MKSLLLVIIFILFNENLWSQTNGQINLIQNFKVGKTYNFEILRGKKISNQPEVEKHKTLTNVSLIINLKKDNYKECSWIYKNTTVTDFDPKLVDEQTNKSINVYEGIEIKFSIDNNGSFLELLNFEECQKSLEDVFYKLTSTGLSDYSSEQKKILLAGMQPSFKNQEVLLNTYFPEISIYFNLLGEKMKTDSSYSSISEFPNPLGGNNIPCETINKIDKIQNQVATIKTNLMFSQDDFNKIIKETMKNLSTKYNRPFNENEIPKMKVDRFTIINYDLKKNEIIEAYSEKSIETDDEKQTETLKVILKN